MRSERIGDHPMKVITISREFGSGGRELGKRLADQLGYAYYDREIEEHVAHRMDLDEGYISRAIEQGALINVPLHFGRTLASSHMLKQQVSILVEKQRVLREIAAASNCVIVGRAADAMLADQTPFRLFVYADMEHKVQRCRAYAEPGEGLSGRELEQSIRRMDAKRADYYRMFADVQWGKKENYHLCVNTTGLEIKKIVPSVAQYVTACF